MNTVRTAMLLAAMTALFIGIGFLIGGSGGAILALAVAMATNFFAWWNADRIVLTMNRAREVDARTAPEFYAIVRNLAARAGLPMPRVYVADNPQPNAFATGRDPGHAAVCATTGLLSRLTPEEIAGVMAHELGHVRNRDTLTMTVTATLAGAIAMLANFALFFGGGRNNNNPLGLVGVLVAALVAPVAAMIVQMAVSRTREYEADRAGAEISGKPRALASALAKIADLAPRVRNPDAERNPAAAHLFIVNPLAGGGVDSLFSTHPATANRIARLLVMADASGDVDLGAVRRPVAVPRVGTTRARGPWG